MLIVPIVNRNRILNVQISLKDLEKVKSDMDFMDALESDIVVNGQKFSESSLKNSKEENISSVDFIRHHSMIYKDDYFITTRRASDSDLYDVYQMTVPIHKVSDGLDNLYGSVITDIRKEIPGIVRGRYISFEKLGVFDHLTDEKIARLQEIIKEEKNQARWPQLFKQAGISDLPETIEFINLFDCTIISDTTLPEDSFKDLLTAFAPLNSKDSRNLKNYYDMALANQELYGKLLYINKLLYNRPLDLIKPPKNKQKQYVKTSGDYRNAT